MKGTIVLNMADLCWLIGGGTVRNGRITIRLQDDVANRSAAVNAAAYADNTLGGIAKDEKGESRTKMFNDEIQD